MIVLHYLSTADQVRADWWKCQPFLARCVEEAVNGEYTVDDLYQLSLLGRALPFYAERDGEVQVAGVLEIIRYPRQTALNVMALAGSNLETVAHDCFEDMKKFAAWMGADYVEASAAPAMTRLLRRLGFSPIYQTVRCAISKQQQGEEHGNVPSQV